MLNINHEFRDLKHIFIFISVLHAGSLSGLHRVLCLGHQLKLRFHLSHKASYLEGPGKTDSKLIKVVSGSWVCLENWPGLWNPWVSFPELHKLRVVMNVILEYHHRGRQEGQMFRVIFGCTVSSRQLWMHGTNGEMR